MALPFFLCTRQAMALNPIPGYAYSATQGLDTGSRCHFVRSHWRLQDSSNGSNRRSDRSLTSEQGSHEQRGFSTAQSADVSMERF